MRDIFAVCGTTVGNEYMRPCARFGIASSPPAPRNDIVTLERVLPWWFSDASLFAVFGSLFG
jgi:hypothetical protein